MTDRYGALREALPILIAEAQAKGGRNERAALIVQLLEDRDALQAENERLRAEVERVTRELMDATARADKLAEALEEVLRVNETDAGSDVKAWANAMLNAHAALAHGGEE